MQEQHENQVKEIRKAGHDTLAVIVEEYKVPLKLNLQLTKKKKKNSLSSPLRESFSSPSV